MIITMVKFSNDVDILRYEPGLFGELHLSSQVLISGSDGILNSGTLSASGADFVSSQVETGQVIYLSSSDGVLDGAYEIVSVDSATTVSVSVLRANGDDEEVVPADSSVVSYRVCTYGPQAAEVGFELTEYFGIGPGNPSSDIDADDILDASVLRRASVYGVLANVYATLGSKAEDENFWKKSLYYQRLFEKARERCRLSIDSDGDGVAEVTKVGWSLKMVRD